MDFLLIKQKSYKILVLLVLLLFMGCWNFLYVDQPDLTDPNSFFDVPISIGLTPESEGGRGYFGILLPIGWTAEDSISYSGVHSGTFIYSNTSSDSMENLRPAPLGYYWWVCQSDTVDSLLGGTVAFRPRIHTSNQTGTFFINYMIADGFEWNTQWGENTSGYYPISVNAPMTVAVTNTYDNGVGSLRLALADVSNTGEILFNLSYPATIQLDSHLVIDRNVTITGPESGDLSIFGTDSTRVIYIKRNLKSVNISNLRISHGDYGHGGGINCANSNLSLYNVVISNNYAAGGQGGGIFFFDHSPYPFLDVGVYTLKMNKVSLVNNKAYWEGGALYCGGTNSAVDIILNNVTMSNNSAPQVGGISGSNFSAIIVNSIFWNNFPGHFANSNLNIFYSDVMGGWPGEGNINADPMFVDTANGNFRLQAGSPCIDAGTALFEFGGDTLINLNPWQYNGSAPDMGAYEFGPPLGITEELNSPKVYTLKQNYPNPFNPSTTIEFSIPKSEFVTLKIYNLLGQEVVTLVSERLTLGNYKYTWDAGVLASGVYMYKIEAGNFIQIHKMILLK